MRGPFKPHQRAGARLQPPNEADSRTYTTPAPFGGWNANGNLSSMPPTDAVIMDNFFPGIVDVSTRRGSTSWATGFPGAVKRLMPYQGPVNSKLFASTANAVYDATANAPIGAAAFSCLNPNWSHVNIATAGGTFLVMVNGADDLKLYNGAAWQSINGGSVPAITGIATTSLSTVALFKRRLWFIEKDSMNLWYLPVDSIAGAAAVFPVGALFPHGGKVVAIADWTIDNGAGADDYFAIMTSRGEVAVYQGTDPSSSTTWALVGVYDIGMPVGDQPLIPYGGDLLALTKSGIFPLSRFLQSTVIERNSALSTKIQTAFIDFVQDYGLNYGWQGIVYKNANFFLVNVPTSTTESFQCVMNLTNRSWCRFLGLNASAWAVLGDALFFANGAKVSIAWTGTSDDGAAIQGTIVQAYNSMGYAAEKQISLVRPHVAIDGPANISYAMDTDFKAYGGISALSYTIPGGQGIWDDTLWDQCVWTEGVYPLRPSWLAVPADLGYLHAFRLQTLTSSATVAWTATNFLYRPAGIL